MSNKKETVSEQFNFKQLREATGLTMAQAAERAGYGKGTIADLENHAEGSGRLRAKLLEIYGVDLSAGRPVARGIDSIAEQLISWKSRANLAERRLEVLQNALRRALDTADQATETLRGAALRAATPAPSSEPERARADALKLASDVVRKRGAGRVP
jgi:transcriptional regulator with XRE-family HTH domain